MKIFLAFVGGPLITPYASTEPSSPAVTSNPWNIEPRADDQLQLYDSWGDYGFHNLMTPWAPYKPLFRFPDDGDRNQQLGLYPKVESWDQAHDPTFNQNAPKRYWAQSATINDPIKIPVSSANPAPVDPAGFAIPEEWEFQHRKFNRSESTFAIKYWKMTVADADCSAIVANNCPGSGRGNKLEVDNDRAIADCLYSLPSSCKVTVTGFTNFTSNHIPELCCSNVFAMTLPSPGNVVPIQECTYGDITVHNFSPMVSLRDSNYGNSKWLVPKSWHDLAKHPKDAWMVDACIGGASEPYKRGCQARIEFGNDLFTDRYDKALKVPLSKADLEQKGSADDDKQVVVKQECRPPEFLHSMTIKPEEDYEFYPSEYGVPQWTQGRPDSYFLMDAGKMNLVVRIEKLRERLGDKTQRQFTMQISGSSFYTWCGPFTGVGVPVKCNTHGLQDYYTRNESPRPLIDSRITK